MRDCCGDKEQELASLRTSHRQLLWTVLAINLAMFVIEMVSGLLSGSTSLKADSLDMLGDSMVYGFSLLVLAKDEKWQARASLLKGSIMLAFGVGVLAEAANKLTHNLIPTVEVMGWVGLLALVMNAACFTLLWKHREDNINMQSTWICSRNDLIANFGVLIAAGLTLATNSKWPDVVIGTIIAAIFLRSAISVLTQALPALAKKT